MDFADRRSDDPAVPGSRSGPRPVTANQRAILLRLFAGAAEPEIAAATGRKPSTIFNTVRRVRDQLGARNEYDLMRECLSRGIITLAEIDALAQTLPRPPRKPAGRRRH